MNLKACAGGVMIGLWLGTFAPNLAIAEMAPYADKGNSLQQPHGRIFYLYRKVQNVNTEEHKNKARQLIMTGQDYSLALAELNLVIDLDKEDAEAFLLRGLAYTEMDKFEEAEADYKAALMLEPENPTFYYFRGQNFLLWPSSGSTTGTNFTGQYDWVSTNKVHALEMFQKALEIEPGYIDAIVGIGDVCYTIGTKKQEMVRGKEPWLGKAIDQYNKVLVLFGNNDVIKAKKELAEQTLRAGQEAEQERKRKEKIRSRIG